MVMDAIEVGGMGGADYVYGMLRLGPGEKKRFTDCLGALVREGRVVRRQDGFLSVVKEEEQKQEHETVQQATPSDSEWFSVVNPNVILWIAQSKEELKPHMKDGMFLVRIEGVVNVEVAIRKYEHET
jgi:hypothetical protein